MAPRSDVELRVSTPDGTGVAGPVRAGTNAGRAARARRRRHVQGEARGRRAGDRHAARRSHQYRADRRHHAEREEAADRHHRAAPGHAARVPGPSRRSLQRGRDQRRRRAEMPDRDRDRRRAWKKAPHRSASALHRRGSSTWSPSRPTASTTSARRSTTAADPASFPRPGLPGRRRDLTDHRRRDSGRTHDPHARQRAYTIRGTTGQRSRSCSPTTRSATAATSISFAPTAPNSRRRAASSSIPASSTRRRSTRPAPGRSSSTPTRQGPWVGTTTVQVFTVTDIDRPITLGQPETASFTIPGQNVSSDSRGPRATSARSSSPTSRCPTVCSTSPS